MSHKVEKTKSDKISLKNKTPYSDFSTMPGFRTFVESTLELEIGDLSGLARARVHEALKTWFWTKF